MTQSAMRKVSDERGAGCDGARGVHGAASAQEDLLLGKKPVTSVQEVQGSKPQIVTQPQPKLRCPDCDYFTRRRYSTM